MMLKVYSFSANAQTFPILVSYLIFPAQFRRSGGGILFDSQLTMS